MFALALFALFLAAGLFVGGYVIARAGRTGRRRTVIVAAVLLAAGGVTVPAMPAAVTPSPEPMTSAPMPAAVADAGAGAGAAADERRDTRAGAATVAANATVVAVSAPDRLTYRTGSGARRTVRLAGVDAPGLDAATLEPFDGVPTGDQGRRCLADHGQRALVDLRTDLVGAGVTVRTTSTAVGTRTAVVTVDGQPLNRRLVERGRARATDGRYADAERAAQNARRGIWSCGVVEPTRPIRESNTSALRIVAVHPNPPDDAAAGIDDEFIIIENTGERAIDLSDWSLIVDDTHYYFFGDRRLQPGAELVVSVGTGRDDEGRVYWATGRPVLDDGSGTIRLIDGDTDRSVWLSY
ncbi:lamin tail domain-containing protein [Haloplanus sp.]|uniref:lamin tail domain-containing protein n=1 Tax=Haloplanus sp. TaxID=1961696 RepID=UPI00260A3DB6|nr:lamin tail domain-containing protein [Haloplanus sp.]